MARTGPACQKPQTKAPAVLTSHHDNSQIPLTSGDGVPATSCPFHPPRSKPRPAPQTSTNSAQNLELGHENLDTIANEEDSLDQEVDNFFVASGAQSHKGRKTIEFWTIPMPQSSQKN
ncbi:hypothetical protein AHAS_Ahas15G0132000 [Arachis hypogaea]